MDLILEGLSTSSKIKALMSSRTPEVTNLDLAILLDVTEQTIRNWIKADKWPSTCLKKIAETYEIDPGLLI